MRAGRTIRLNMTLDERSFHRINELKHRLSDPSNSAVVRRALILLDTISEEMEKGSNLFVEGEDGQKTKIKFI